MVMDLGVNGKPMHMRLPKFLLVIVTLAVSATVFEIYSRLKIENC